MTHATKAEPYEFKSELKEDFSACRREFKSNNAEMRANLAKMKAQLDLITIISACTFFTTGVILGILLTMLLR